MVKRSSDWNARLIEFFVHNSRLVWLIILCIAIGGTASILSLRREGFPKVSPKIALIQTVYPGATAQEVEIQITQEIEAALKDADGVKEVSSTSQNSFSNVTVQLEESVELDKAIQDTQSKVQAATANLPTDAEPPKVRTFNTGGAAFTLGITQTGASVEGIKHEAQQVAILLPDVVGIK
jgi:multidrug efflux pump subunit AcrB